MSFHQLLTLASLAVVLAAATMPARANAQATSTVDSCRLKTNGATASYTISGNGTLAVCQAMLHGLNRPYAGLYGQGWEVERVGVGGAAGEPVCWTTDADGREWVVLELSIVPYRTLALRYCNTLTGVSFAPLQWSPGAAGSGATSDTIVFALMGGWNPSPGMAATEVELAAQRFIATLQDICRQQLTEYVVDGVFHWEWVPLDLRASMQQQCLPETISQLARR